MEGVAMSLLDCKKYLQDKGITVGETAYIIGGGAKSRVWRSIVADVTGLTLVSTKVNDSSFGSAMCAGIQAGFFSDYDNAIKTCSIKTDITLPNKENFEKYGKIFAKYKKISNFLVELANER